MSKKSVVLEPAYGEWTRFCEETPEIERIYKSDNPFQVEFWKKDPVAENAKKERIEEEHAMMLGVKPARKKKKRSQETREPRKDPEMYLDPENNLSDEEFKKKVRDYEADFIAQEPKMNKEVPYTPPNNVKDIKVAESVVQKTAIMRDSDDFVSDANMTPQQDSGFKVFPTTNINLRDEDYEQMIPTSSSSRHYRYFESHAPALTQKLGVEKLVVQRNMSFSEFAEAQFGGARQIARQNKELHDQQQQ